MRILASRSNPLNLITLHRWEIQLCDGMPDSLIVGFHQPGKGTWMLSAYGLADAIREAADLAGLDAEFRDAQGEEWDILIPEDALAYEFPEGHLDDYRVERRRQTQLSRAGQGCDDPDFHWERKAVIFERWRARYYPKFDKHWELKGDHAVLTVRLPTEPTIQPWE